MDNIIQDLEVEKKIKKTTYFLEIISVIVCTVIIDLIEVQSSSQAAIECKVLRNPSLYCMIGYPLSSMKNLKRCMSSKPMTLVEAFLMYHFRNDLKFA